MQPAIRVENLGKRYRVAQSDGPRASYRTLRESLVGAVAGPLKRLRGSSAAPSSEDFWALKDVSFEVQPGEVVGIIGRNGAGKSTLLKILSRITKPTTGRVELNGRVGSLLEVGTGFHPELTGRENVYLNGSILGMSRKEIDRKFDEIVAFAEIEKFLDTPVKRYSSGMYVRLAFAVAAHLEPEILIVDEVLAVGDAGFQKKCLGKIREVSSNGRTVILVSHNSITIELLTNRCFLLVHGRLHFAGNTRQTLRLYRDEPAELGGSHYSLRNHMNPLDPEATVQLLWASFACSINTFYYYDIIRIEISVGIRSFLDHFRVSYTIFRSDGMPIGSAFSNPFLRPLICDSSTYIIELADHRLSPGNYYFDLAVGKGNNVSGPQIDFDIARGILHFQIKPASVGDVLPAWDFGWGAIQFPASALNFASKAG